MKITSITAFLCLFIALAAAAQKSPVKFGDIPTADLTMTVYSKDSSASAVVLSDYGEAYIKEIGESVVLSFERHVRIKILKKEGLEWANVAIPLYHVGQREERVNNLKAVTYNLENGAVVETKMQREGVFKEKSTRYYDRQKFTLPNVKVGSVIEYSYTVNSEFYTQFPNWEFQYTIPVRWSEFWAIMPENFIYQKYMQGYIQTSSYDVKPLNISGYSATGHHWICKDVPAFKEEPYMTSEEDYVSRINFALSHINLASGGTREIMGSWETLRQGLLENDAFWGVIKGSSFLKTKVEELTAGVTDPKQKVEKIYNYVKQTLEWDGTKDYLADNLKKIFEAKKGTSGDINLALGSMLDKAGFDVNMILVSTRDHGFIRQSYPMSRQFNYVICSVKLDDKTVFLDATERLLPLGVIPERCLNGEGFLVSKKDFGWVKVETKTKEKITTNADLKLDESGELSGSLNFTRDGYAAHKMRKEYLSKGQETFVKDFLGSKSWDLKKSEFQNVEDLSVSPKQIHDISIADHITAAGDIMYLNPFLINEFQSNPFMLDVREYPVDFGKNLERVYMLKIQIPEKYTVDELPKSKVISLTGNAARYSYSSSQTGNIINVICVFQINKSLFVQDEYPNLKEFYNQIVAKQNEQIVIRKK